MKKIISTMCLFSFLLVFYQLNAQNASCPAPLYPATSSIGTNSAVLSWTDSSNAIMFHVQWRPVANPPVNYIHAVSQVPYYQLNGLQCHTSYEWRVQAVCANSNGMSMMSPFTTPVVFTTLPCQGMACPVPTGLNATNITASSAVLSWLSTNLATVYNLRYRSMMTATWTTLHNVTPPYTLSNLQCNTTYEWQVQSACVTPQGSALSSWSASHFFTTLVCPVLCPAPGGLNASNITSYSATLSWNGITGAVGYQVRYRPSSTVNWSYATSITNMVTISGLLCNTSYIWQVRAICTPAINNTATSGFSSPHTFTTLACPSLCQVPSGLNASNITSTTAVLSWNPTNANAYHVRYRKAGSAPTPSSGWTMLYTINTSVTITGLQPGTVYEWQVQSVCAGSTNNTIVVSGWSALHTFSTSLLLTAVPNPANQYTDIRYFAAEGSTVTIEVRDIVGNLLSRMEQVADNDMNSMRLNTAAWKEGIYYLKLISPSGTQTLRLIIKH